MARILLVDDDIDLLEATAQWLTREQHSVDAVSTGLKGLEYMEKNAYDLVILDWDLPDLNGIDVLKTFREAGGTTPVLLLTGRTSVDNKAEGLDTGANDYLTKPFHMKELSARIRAVLRSSEFQLSLKPLAASN